MFFNSLLKIVCLTDIQSIRRGSKNVDKKGHKQLSDGNVPCVTNHAVHHSVHPTRATYTDLLETYRLAHLWRKPCTEWYGAEQADLEP